MNRQDLKDFNLVAEKALEYNDYLEEYNKIFDKPLEVTQHSRHRTLIAKPMEIGAIYDGKISISNADFVVWYEGLGTTAGAMRYFKEAMKVELTLPQEKIEVPLEDEWKLFEAPTEKEEPCTIPCVLKETVVLTKSIFEKDLDLLNKNMITELNDKAYIDIEALNFFKILFDVELLDLVREVKETMIANIKDNKLDEIRDELEKNLNDIKGLLDECKTSNSK